MKRISTHLLLALGLAWAAACAAPPSAATGSVQLAVSVSHALSASDVTRVRVTVSAADMSSLAVDLAQSNGSWGGLLGNILEGSNRSFLAEAFDASGTLRFQGATSGVSISANQTTAVALTLQELAPAPPYSNEAPVIDSVVASSTSVQTGTSLSLTATVHDPNTGDTLALAWTASGGTFSAPAAASTSWTAPSTPGVQTLTFTVTDSQGAAVSLSLTVNVVSGASTGSAALSVSFNLWPVVSKVSASLNRLDAGQSTAVSALVSDADGDALSYQWTASCPGTWTHDTASAASFVPSSVPASACNNCRLTVTVQDGRGGQTTGSLNLCVASSSTQRFPPSITNSYQSATTASPGQTVDFDVTTLDSQASALTFHWTANTGSLAAPQNTATTSHVMWTAPSCAIAGMPPSLTVTVTNAFNLTTTQSFTVMGLPVCASGWAAAGSMATARSEHGATLLNNGRVLISGGYSGSVYLATAELYDPGSGTWSAAASMTTPRSYHTATRLPDGKILVAGGYNSSSGVLTAAEVYDPASGTWSATAPLASARQGHMATLLTTGKVLVVGGQSSAYLASAEVYDPASGTWSATAPMASPRRGHTATLLSNGKVFVLGGYSGSAYVASAEVYDPASGTWSTVASMASARARPTATLLPNGKVLVTGGFHGGYLASAEVYDPASTTWSTVASMTAARAFHSAALLPTGKVLVAGGFNGSSYLAGAAVYDPDSSTWSAAAPMAVARDYFTATPLPTGKILISGGYIGSTSIAGAELYTP